MGKSEVWLDAFALMNSRPVIRLAVQKKEDATIPSGSALPARLPPGSGRYRHTQLLTGRSMSEI